MSDRGPFGNRHERRLVAFLSSPAAYPQPVGGVERRETHVSHVFLAGAFAYKLKKPVNFPFLDASTLTRRRRFCELELSLNRRLAKDVYLGLVPVVATHRGLRLGGTGRVVEWLVKMRRLPDARMLDQLVARGRIRPREIARIADRLVQFFHRSGRNLAIDRAGHPVRVAELVLGNLKECEPFVPGLLRAEDRRRIESAFRQYLLLDEPLLMRRVREQRIIDGHGDLRCENICMTDPVAIFDCVEFESAFRYGDVGNDLAFLAMDLEFRGRGDLARVLVRRYLRSTQDACCERLLPFYKCHRSLVRGKVRALAWLQHPRTAEGRRLRAFARAHFLLAQQYARQFAPPRLVVIGGMIGTGKSTLARRLSQAMGAAWLRTDEIRLREFATARRFGRGFATGLYAPRISVLVYQRLIQRAEQHLRRGDSVVCDGMFSRASGRQQLRKIARRHGASFYYFECVAPQAVAMRRVGRRYAEGRDLSEARPALYDRLKRGVERVSGWPSSVWSRLSTARPPEVTYQRAVETLRHAWTTKAAGG